jgi:ribosomal protein L16 Arg81 hydroxylase
MKTFQGLSIVFLFLLPLCITGQLTQQLIDALKRNPALISSLQNNPELLKSLLLQTQRQNQQQQQQIQQPKPGLPQALQQRRRLNDEPQQLDQCSTLRKQNKLLRQMIFFSHRK